MKTMMQACLALFLGIAMIQDLDAKQLKEEQLQDKQAITKAIQGYFLSQVQIKPELMQSALHPKLRKRTYWLDKDSKEFILETSVDTMIRVAETYNKDGDAFPARPRMEIQIYDIDQRTASAKLTVDDWIDYMHLVKTSQGEWKILNVLWQFHETSKQQDQKQ